MNNRYLSKSFFDQIPSLINKYKNLSTTTSNNAEIEKTLSKKNFDLNDLLILLNIDREEHLEKLLELAQNITIQRFGKKINLYAPMYVSNYCNNNCVYCGFNSSKKTNRTILNPEEILKESHYLKNIGIEHLLIVSGEAENIAGFNYFKDILNELNDQFHCIGFEIQPLKLEEYKSLYSSGLDGVTLYQETYLPELYNDYHRTGNKKDYRFRLETPERVARADIPNSVTGILLGLAPYKLDLMLLAEHLHYLLNKYWKTQFSVSFPRVRNESIEFKIPYPVSDFEYVKIISLMRLVFPDTPIYISTREASYLRDHLINYGITCMSVESKTEPGGYTLHLETAKQFQIVDERNIKEIISMLSKNNLRPVLKDWDKGYRINN